MPVTIFPSPVTVISGTVAATQGTTPWVENLAQVGGNPVALGQGSGANSIPVVLPTDQLQSLDLATASRQDVLIGIAQYLQTLILNCDTSNVSIANLPATQGVAGDTASGVADAGNPVKIGGTANSAAPTPVTAGQRVNAWSDLYGRSVVSDLDPEWNLASGLTALRDKLSVQRYTVLADSIADGFASFWTFTNVNGGTSAVSIGEGLIQSSATNGGIAQMVSSAPAYYPGQVAWLNSAFRFGDLGVAGSTLRVGACTVIGTTPQDGFYYELNGITLNAVTVKAGVATAVASTAWARVAASPFTLDTNYHQFELRWTANRADFLVDNVLRHTASGGATALTGTLNFPIFIQVSNASAGVNRLLAVRNIGIGRFGTPDSLSSNGPLSIAKAQNIAYASGDVGIPAMAVRKAAPGNTSTADGDYEQLQMANGRLWTSDPTVESALRVDQLDMLRSILLELRILNYNVKSGLNVVDEPEIMRLDPFFNNPLQ